MNRPRFQCRRSSRSNSWSSASCWTRAGAGYGRSLSDHLPFTAMEPNTSRRGWLPSRRAIGFRSVRRRRTGAILRSAPSRPRKTLPGCARAVTDGSIYFATSDEAPTIAALATAIAKKIGAPATGLQLEAARAVLGPMADMFAVNLRVSSTKAAADETGKRVSMTTPQISRAASRVADRRTACFERRGVVARSRPEAVYPGGSG